MSRLNTLPSSLALIAISAFAAAPAYAAATPSEDVAAVETSSGNLTLRQDGRIVFAAALPPGAKVVREVSDAKDGPVVETLRIDLPAGATLKGVVTAGLESFAAETKGAAQAKFPMIRTAHGPSSNLRNNAVYERTADWMLEFPEGTRIAPHADATAIRYDIAYTGTQAVLTFRPAYYRKFKNLPYYAPWTYRVRKDSITGWSSWWAYMRGFNEKDLNSLLAVFTEKKFADYGYRFVQIDDAYQGGKDAGMKHSRMNGGYLGGRPETWLDWKKDLFPSGLDGYVRANRKAGFSPAIWMGSFFSDTAVPASHPDWFVRDEKGRPTEGSWVSFVIDSRKAEAANTLIRPTFRGLRKAGVEYVKIDQLRHMLYDNLNKHPEYTAKTGTTGSDLFRNYLKIAREELGPQTFILACWGVLPEAIGLADACRIGGDGYGPATLQQYNSWNGVVWRNDPDHCDVLPRKGAAEAGNVTRTVDIKAAPNDTLIRPALASIAGAMLMLSDKPDVYKDEANLTGLRKSSPVLFSVPGQLYDFDARKSEYLRTHARAEIKNGAPPAPVDADQFGEVCPFWLNEFSSAAGEWNVLNRLNWAKADAPARTVAFADIGLSPEKEYIVHEFWSGVTVGVRKGSFETAALPAMGLASYAIREKLDRPQLVSTSRHLSQGAAEIENLVWDETNLSLSGKSRIVAGDDYSILVRAPAGYSAVGVTLDSRPVEGATRDGEYLKIPLRSAKTASAVWRIAFKRD